MIPATLWFEELPDNHFAVRAGDTPVGMILPDPSAGPKAVVWSFYPQPNAVSMRRAESMNAARKALILHYLDWIEKSDSTSYAEAAA